ncbi:hypothetical protein [Lysobacter sp. CA199]|uniref:hypothetical protein n=1 Tax=Lysobacter sp. CA199 TaxID=3455608 RepID=UPI003F8D59CF
MHHSTDTKPGTAAPHADHGTGTTGKASTLARDESRMLEHLRLAIGYFDAAECRYLAEAAEHRAMAAIHRCDPHCTPGDRALKADTADYLAKEATRSAAQYAKHARTYRATLPSQPEAVAVEIVLTIGHDTIQQTAKVSGSSASVARTWARISTGTWRCRDPRWDDFEHVLGEDLCEYLNHIPLPEDVAKAIAALATARASGRCGAHG